MLASLSYSSSTGSTTSTTAHTLHTMARSVDLVISFSATKKKTQSSTQTKKEAERSKRQYARLLETLTYPGLRAVGRRGESLGYLLVFVSCPTDLLDSLVRRERHFDFLSGLPVTPLPEGVTIGPLTPAERIRLVHAYITSMPADGGLGVTPDSPDWDCVESIFPLRDREFNEAWVRSWKPKQLANTAVGRVREEFGDSVAYYYSFLSAYTYFLIFPAILGLIANFFLEPYSPTYSILTCIWSIVFVEWWTVHERILSLRFHTSGSEVAEKRRARYKPGLSWWGKDLRVLASVPLIILFASILAVLLTGIFVLEAFVTTLYEGPGKQVISFMPTVLFAALVPRLLAIYHSLAARFTEWENHPQRSSHEYSLTIKTFALSAIVSYLGLGLSAFIYVPFGESIMQHLQLWLFNQTGHSRWQLRQRLWALIPWNSTTIGNSFLLQRQSPITNIDPSTVLKIAPDPVAGPSSGLWNIDLGHARQKLDPSRLKDQMFAYTVTNQVTDTFTEVGMPFVMRAINNAFGKSGKAKKSTATASVSASASGSPRPKSPAPITPTPSMGVISSGVSSSAASTIAGTTSPSLRKRVVFEDEQERGGLEEREFLDRVREEAALPEYNLFQDYSEMVTQFGYVAVWSTIWPLAAVMALVNNFFEIRSDAFKMTVHFRRPIPTRTDTIGPWLDMLAFLTWLAALANASLVYLFSPASQNVFTKAQSQEGAALGERGIASVINGSSAEMELLLMRALLIALIASHGYILVRALVRHVVERVWWKERSEVMHREREVRAVRERFLRGLGSGAKRGEKLSMDWSWSQGSSSSGQEGSAESNSVAAQGDAGAILYGFWDHDDGLEEIERISKDS